MVRYIISTKTIRWAFKNINYLLKKKKALKKRVSYYEKEINKSSESYFSYMIRTDINNKNINDNNNDFWGKNSSFGCAS